MLLGDWNRREDSFPLAGFLAKGVVWTMDGEQCPRDGTYRRGGRLTYYGPAPDHLSDARLPGGGHAALAAAAAFAFGGAGPMGHTWQAFALSFEAAVEGHDVTKAWQVLSAAAEEVMADPEGRPARPRAEPGRAWCRIATVDCRRWQPSWPTTSRPLATTTRACSTCTPI